MKHGADLLSYFAQEENIIDFSSNINPLGFPENLPELFISCCASVQTYPDIKYRHLKNAVAEYLGCTVRNVNVGSGAVEIIDAFIQTAERVLVCVPCFSEYYIRAEVHKKEVVYIPLKKNNFEIDCESIKQNLRRGDLLIIGNPNNPTGLRIEQKMLENIYKICTEKNAFLLLDEAFHEFTLPCYDSISVFNQTEYKNIAVIRAATKFFALPGIRLGYSCTNEDKAAEIGEKLLPWNVNSFANAAGMHIFKNKNYIETSIRNIRRERTFLISELEKINASAVNSKHGYIKIYPAQANFILIKLLKACEDEIFEHCLKNKILIRKCSTFKGLEKNHIRIAVRTNEENKKLIDCLKNIFLQNRNGLKNSSI